MKSSIGWYEGNGTNESGFSALPCGFYDSEEVENFDALELDGYFWSNNQNIQYLTIDSDGCTSFSGSSTQGFSVRCIKD